MSYEKLFESDISTEAVKAWRDKGNKALGVICCHVPFEVLHSAGIMPVRLRGTNCNDSSDAETWMSSFSCSFARSILQYVLDRKYDLDGIVSSDGCMMAGRCYDNIKYLNEKENWGLFTYCINAPRTAGDLSIDFFKEELQFLITKLEELSGNKVTKEKLIESIKLYNQARELTRQVYALRKEKNPVISGSEVLNLSLSFADLPVEEYIELVKEYLADIQNRKPITDYRARLVVIGSALDDPEYIKIIEDKGGLVVGDVNCFGENLFKGDIEINTDDLLREISKFYLERLFCPRMVDTRVDLHHSVIDVVKEYNADGVIYQKMQNCEVWGAESILLNGDLDAANIPYLTVQREESLTSAGQLGIRAEAFIEMVEKED